MSSFAAFRLDTLEGPAVAAVAPLAMRTAHLKLRAGLLCGFQEGLWWGVVVVVVVSEMGRLAQHYLNAARENIPVIFGKHTLM